MSSMKLNREREPQITFPVQILEKKYVGELKGYYVENTNSYNVLPFDDAANINENKIYSIGFILPVNPFNFVDKEIASQIQYLKSEESSPDEIVRKMQQALQNPNNDKSFKYLKGKTAAQAIREQIALDLKYGGEKPIELDNLGNVIVDDEFTKETSNFIIKFSSEVISKISLNNYAFHVSDNDKLCPPPYDKDKLYWDNAKKWIKNTFLIRLYLQSDDIRNFDKVCLNANTIVGYWENDELHFVQLRTRQECKQDKYSLKLDVFSRNTGILESDIMLEKGAMFIGCGSVGSLFALELAKAGVGRFLLIDNDIFGYHNICRHQCGIYDVGRYKTESLAERILQVNPYAKIVTKNMTVQDVPIAELVEFCDKNTIVIGGADNREGDLYANNLAQQIEMPFMSIGCWERAFAGEIFYCLPKGMPNYQDFVEVTGTLSGRVTQNRRFYTTEEDLKKATFEPGISADINYVTIIAVKMALDILNIDNEKYTQRLLPYLTQYTLVCNTNNTQIGGETAEIFSYPLQVTTSIVVPYSKK